MTHWKERQNSVKENCRIINIQVKNLSYSQQLNGENGGLCMTRSFIKIYKGKKKAF